MSIESKLFCMPIDIASILLRNLRIYITDLFYSTKNRQQLTVYKKNQRLFKYIDKGRNIKISDWFQNSIMNLINN